MLGMFYLDMIAKWGRLDHLRCVAFTNHRDARPFDYIYTIFSSVLT